jgi:hypothetical protein
MYIELTGRGDRLGANIVCFLAQIMYAYHQKIYIKFGREAIPRGDNLLAPDFDHDYIKSIFVDTLFDFIEKHNKSLGISELGDKPEFFTMQFFELISKVLPVINTDYFTYFKENMYSFMRERLVAKSAAKGYVLPFDPAKSILVHLRLNDCRSRPDYDGRICFDHFVRVINRGHIATMDTQNQLNRLFPINNQQAPLSTEKMQQQIDAVVSKYPDREVILVTNPGEDTSALPYRCIQSQNPSFDMFLLCNSEVLILSRSTFSLCSVFFGIAKDVYLPKWGHLPCFGLGTKYDKTNFNYFY